MDEKKPRIIGNADWSPSIEEFYMDLMTLFEEMEKDGYLLVTTAYIGEFMSQKWTSGSFLDTLRLFQAGGDIGGVQIVNAKGAKAFAWFKSGNEKYIALDFELETLLDT